MLGLVRIPPIAVLSTATTLSLSL